jgi:hypothetical protein
LYCGFFERGVRYFFPEAALEVAARLTDASAMPDGGLDLVWMDLHYRMSQGSRPFTENQMRMLVAIGAVLTARYRSIFFAVSAAATSSVFEGLAEDRFVSAFLDHAPYLDNIEVFDARDVVASAVEVLRESSLITYENRRISTGVLLLGDDGEPPEAPEGALGYTNDLLSIKSFHRLCDGLNTLFLVDREGLLLDLVDVRHWSAMRASDPLPAPSAARYQAHCRATLGTGQICLALTPNGEIKVFAEGAQVFSFVEGRWRLTDAAEKYRQWREAAGSHELGELLFTTALNLAEHRRGGLFLVLDDAGRASSILAPGDLLSNEGAIGYQGSAKPRLHYLLRGKRVLEMEPAVLESVARMDGGIVLDRAGNLLAFGAILRPAGDLTDSRASEGGRTTAAMQSSHYGAALKISEDGIVSFYKGGVEVWSI